MAENGEMERIKSDYPDYYLRFKRTLQSLLNFDITELSGSCGVWICGPPRCGEDYAVTDFEGRLVNTHSITL